MCKVANDIRQSLASYWMCKVANDIRQSLASYWLCKVANGQSDTRMAEPPVSESRDSEP
jgi:hypothetical protein